MIIPQLIPSTALGMGGKLPPSDRIVMGAIGLGSQGTSNMRGFLKRVKELQLVAVCDVHKLKSDKAKKIVDESYKNSDCRTYSDYREFLEKEKLDAVSIALPDHWHGLIYSAVANKKILWNPENEVIIGNPVASRMLARHYRQPWNFPTH